MISIEDHLSALISKERCLPTDLSDTVQFNLLIFILEKKDLYQLPTNIKKFHFLVNCLWIPNDCKLKPDFPYLCYLQTFKLQELHLQDKDSK